MRAPEHIIIINDVAHVNGGAAKVCIEEAKALAIRGLQVTFFAPCGPVDDDLRAAGVEVICLDQRDVIDEPHRLRALTRGLWNATAARALAAVVTKADRRRTLLHAHSFSRALSPAFGPVFTRSGLAHVYTMHEYFLACPNGGFFHYPQQRICHRRALGPACIIASCDARSPWHKPWRLARQALLWTIGNMPRGLRNIIYISRTQLAVMQPYLPPHARLHYLPNPVARDPEVERVRAEDNEVFLFVGRLSPEKGAVDFARAAREAGVRAVFLGAGPEESRVRAVNPEAELVGWVGADEVAAWMRKSRALVFPSLWYEGQPLVSMEALSMGLPVIVGAWNAAVEQIEHERTGLIYTQREALAAMLTRMTPALAGELSRNAFAQRELYGLSIEQHVDRLLEIYAQAGPTT